MKRLLKVVSILLLVVSLFSCGSAIKDSTTKENVANNATTVTTEIVQTQSTQQAQQVQVLSTSKWQTDEEKEIDQKYHALKLKYSKHREDFSSDEVFANFRNVKLGKIKEGILYRGASPIDNSMGRAKYACKLIEEVGVKFDVNLTDNEDKIKRHFSKKDFASYFYKTLYDNGKTILLHMNTNYKEQKYNDRVVKAMIAMSKNEGPYYVHCVEGKNRTGFVLAVIEGLAGASYEEMVKDHMITFANYYGITEESDKEKYDILKARYIDSMLKYILSNDSQYANTINDFKDVDWVNVMHSYLTRNGMSEEDIENWYRNVTG